MKRSTRKAIGEHNARLLQISGDVVSLLRVITKSTIVHGCIDGKPVKEPILPEQFQRRALELLAVADRNIDERNQLALDSLKNVMAAARRAGVR
jgi:hypothetical protein